jgi:hypothetical protein
MPRMTDKKMSIFLSVSHLLDSHSRSSATIGPAQRSSRSRFRILQLAASGPTSERAPATSRHAADAPTLAGTSNPRAAPTAITMNTTSSPARSRPRSWPAPQANRARLVLVRLLAQIRCFEPGAGSIPDVSTNRGCSSSAERRSPKIASERVQPASRDGSGGSSVPPRTASAASGPPDGATDGGIIKSNGGLFRHAQSLRQECHVSPMSSRRRWSSSSL